MNFHLIFTYNNIKNLFETDPGRPGRRNRPRWYLFDALEERLVLSTAFDVIRDPFDVIKDRLNSSTPCALSVHFPRDYSTFFSSLNINPCKAAFIPITTSTGTLEFSLANY